MTPEQHVKRVRQIAFQLYRADYGLGMPRDYELVKRLRTHLVHVTSEAVAAIHDAFVNGPMKHHEAIEALLEIGEDEAERVVDEWADGAEAELTDNDQPSQLTFDNRNNAPVLGSRQSIEEDRK